MGTHMPYGITQRYLPPNKGDIPTFTVLPHSPGALVKNGKNVIKLIFLE